MKILHTLWLLCCLLLVSTPAKGQTEVSAKPLTIPTHVSKNLKHIRHLTVDDGFTRNSVFRILQDESGFMWFALWDGLYCFDGNKLKNVVTTSTEEKKQNPQINSLLSDHQNRIWVASSKGVYIWDTVKEKYAAFNKTTANGDSISGNINAILKDKFDNIWVLCREQNLFIYNMEHDQMKSLSSVIKEKKYKIQDVYIDNHNQIWLITKNKGFIRIKGDLSAENNPFDCKKWTLEEAPLFSFFKHKHATTLFQDSKDNFWIGTNHYIFQLIPQQEGTAPIIRRFTNHSDIKSIKVSTFLEHANTIYSATNQGLFTYDKVLEEGTWFLPNYTEEHHLNDKSLTDICIDNENGLWICSHYGGVNYLHPTNSNFATHSDLNKQIQGHVISAITEDKHGNVWMGVEDNGVCLWNRKTNQIESFNENRKDSYRPTFHNVQSILADNNEVYVGMYHGGLDIVDINTKKHLNFNSRNTYPDRLSNFIYAFHKMSENTILIGSIEGLFQMDTHTHCVRKIKNISGKVNCISEDELGDIWVSTLQNGFYWYSKTTKKWWHYKEKNPNNGNSIGNSITTIHPMDPSIVVGTQGNGLWLFNKNTKETQQIATHTLKKSIIFDILHKGETLWITTNKGLFAYNITTQHIKQYTIQDGLRSNQFKENSGIITSDGLFVVGGLNGFNCFRPEKLHNNTQIPKVLLTDFYIFNQPADIHDPESPLKQSITHTQHIDLNQKYHSFAFKFSSSSYSDLKENKFEYKLEPFDKNWLHPHGTANMASYTNLPAGKYTFHVRTSNGEGVWSEERCVDITIHPYWWMSWPMKMLYAISIFCFIAQFILRYRRKKKKEMYLFRMEKEQEVYESKMKFFTYMVHEIRTPLTLILGPLNHIMNKREMKVQEVLPDLQIIERNGKRLLSLVNQLMDFRKVEEKSYSVQINKINIKDLIQETAKDFRYYNIQKKVDFEFDIPQEECWSSLDREAFTKILLNLLSNAMKFTKDRIKVSLVRTADGKKWELSVQDNGKGIAKEEQTAIFDSFYQVHQDLPGDYVGTGIGLFVVKKLLLLQGGDIRVESNTDQGAVFIITLPFIESPLPPSQPQQPQEEVSTVQQASLKEEAEPEQQQKSLLIAEDNEEMRNYICSLFVDKYEVDAFENGKEALLASERKPYDLVITDLMMPVMDGMTLCRNLKGKSSTCHIPIIILTAKDDEKSQTEGFESEADMYVTKPFSPDVLQSRVKSLFRNREHVRTKFYSEPETTSEVLYTNDSDKDFLEKLDNLINQKLSDSNLPIDDLAAEMAMGRSAFYQKMKGITGLTPNDYIRTFRLKKAVTLFQKGETRINEVCYRVGFSSPSYFTKRFTQQFGISPSDYLKKHSGTEL